MLAEKAEARGLSQMQRDSMRVSPAPLQRARGCEVLGLNLHQRHKLDLLDQGFSTNPSGVLTESGVKD